MTAKTRATRAGFTLVEMLMVIAIIAILAALLFTGISRVRKTAQVVQARNDISQLETVVTKFKQDFGFYPPSHVVTSAGVMRFMVPNKVSGAGTEQNERSLAVLQRMFPRWNPATDSSTNGTDLNGLPLNGTALDPNQTLVYFLSGPAGGGWDVGKPHVPAGGTKKGPYFDFPVSRLITIQASDPAPIGGYSPGNGIPDFVDPWGVPYAYFSSSGDQYDARTTFPLPTTASTDYTTVGNGSTRPIRMGGKWMNPGKFQIMSAGPNRLFGPGSYATQTNPAVVYLDLQPGKTPGYSDTDNGEDDLANFNEGSNLGTSSAP